MPLASLARVLFRRRLAPFEEYSSSILLLVVLKKFQIYETINWNKFGVQIKVSSSAEVVVSLWKKLSLVRRFGHTDMGKVGMTIWISSGSKILTSISKPTTGG